MPYREEKDFSGILIFYRRCFSMLFDIFNQENLILNNHKLVDTLLLLLRTNSSSLNYYKGEAIVDKSELSRFLY